MKEKNIIYLRKFKTYSMSLSLLILITVFNSCSSEKSSKWEYIFDGETFNGWHVYKAETIGSEWSINNGELIFTNNEEFGQDLVTDKEYTNFELSIEWNISKNGNSGILYGVKELPEFDAPFVTGPEIQVLDNERHPDALANPKFHQAGALYDMVQPTQDVCKAAGEWNDVLLSIDYNTNKGSVTLNGVEIVTFPVSGEKWDALIANSKFSDWDHFAKFKTGKIGLQDHGDMVSYRNIKIREL